jgi:hypothetical protein
MRSLTDAGFPVFGFYSGGAGLLAVTSPMVVVAREIAWAELATASVPSLPVSN